MKRIKTILKIVELVLALIGLSCVVMLFISTYCMPQLEKIKDEEDDDFDYIDLELE